MIQVIHKAATILETIASRNGQKVSLRDIADAAGLNHATCANILQSLKNVGFVEQPDQRKGYTIGFRLASLILEGTSPKDLLSFAFPLVDRLRDRINENVILSVLSGNQREVIYSAEGVHELNATTPARVSVYRASTGRVILAHRQEAFVEELFRQTGLPGADWPEIDSLEGLLCALARIRAEQCYVTVNKSHISSMAVPVFCKGKVIAALGFYLPQVRLEERGEAYYRVPLMETAERLNAALR